MSISKNAYPEAVHPWTWYNSWWSMTPTHSSWRWLLTGQCGASLKVHLREGFGNQKYRCWGPPGIKVLYTYSGTCSYFFSYFTLTNKCPVRAPFLFGSPLSTSIFFSFFVPDLLHEFELGVWKAVFTHLIRILYAGGNNCIQKLNWQYILGI